MNGPLGITMIVFVLPLAVYAGLTLLPAPGPARLGASAVLAIATITFVLSVRAQNANPVFDEPALVAAASVSAFAGAAAGALLLALFPISGGGRIAYVPVAVLAALGFFALHVQILA